MDGNGWRVVGRTLHLVDVPVGLQIGEVANAGIGAEAFRLLSIPKREGVVVAVGIDDWEVAFRQRLKVVAAEVPAGISATSVVVVPRLPCHLDGHEDAKATEHCANHLVLQQLLQVVGDACHSETYPYRVSVEGAGVCIVAFTRLHWRLVKVKHDGETSHEEEEEDDAKLLFAFAVLCLLVVLEELPEQTDEAEQERQAVEDIMSFVLSEFAWQLALVAQSHVVEERDACYPVAMLPFAIAL